MAKGRIQQHFEPPEQLVSNKVVVLGRSLLEAARAEEVKRMLGSEGFSVAVLGSRAHL